MGEHARYEEPVADTTVENQNAAETTDATTSDDTAAEPAQTDARNGFDENSDV